MARDITQRVLKRRIQSPYESRRFEFLSNKWFLLAVLGWALYAGVLSDHSLWNILRLQQHLAETQHQLANAEAETHRLEQQTSDPQAKLEHAEALLRAQGMAKPGEIIYRLGGAVVDSTKH